MKKDAPRSPRSVASSRLARRVPYKILIEAQRGRIAKLTDRIGELMSQRATEEEILAEMFALAPKGIEGAS